MRRSSPFLALAVSGLLLSGCLGKEADPVSKDAAPAPPATEGGAVSNDTLGGLEIVNASRQRTLVSASLANHTATIPCVFALRDAEFPSCDPNDPAPFDDGERKPWVVALDLTTDNLHRLGFNATPKSLVHMVLTWGTNEAGWERFRFCREWPNATGPDKKVCYEPKAAPKEANRLELFEPVFWELSPWREPGVYDVWIEPVPWYSTTYQDSPGEPNYIKNWTFTLTAEFQPPNDSRL